MDFYDVLQASTKDGIDVFPAFKVVRSKDLMVRSRAFYAVWDEENQLWSTDEYDVARLVDKDLYEMGRRIGEAAKVKYMRNFKSGSWKDFKSLLQNLPDNATQLDDQLTFADTKPRKENYSSRHLPYSLQEGPTPVWDELIGTLYEETERRKIEWAIGAVLAGDARYIQKFLVLYGPGGKGKGTILNIIQMLFEGYYTVFESKSITSSNNSFASGTFKDNPLVAIDPDGDLSKIEDNTKLNSIISHEEILINEKFKPAYMGRVNAFLFMGTNKPVKITDAKSGIIRRLIDAKPSGKLIDTDRYHVLMGRVQFELGAIAHKCLDVYRAHGRDYYSNYRPTEMMLETDIFYNFVESYFDIFKAQDSTTLDQAYKMYKLFCEDSQLRHILPRHTFREELRNYFKVFQDRGEFNNQRVRSLYSVFLTSKFTTLPLTPKHALALTLDRTKSPLDEMLADCPAQYAVMSSRTHTEIPKAKWDEVETTLRQIDTKEVHYVKPPTDHIVIDFDLTDETGEKSAEMNLRAASEWPPTYAEYSKSGTGVHLHYIYNGDVGELSRIFSDGIEIKVFTGEASLRRRMSRCNSMPVAKLSGGLPLREKKMIDFDGVITERGMRTLIEKNLHKMIHPGTKPSVDFIHKILDDAYKSGVKYDVTNLRPRVMAFAANSTNQSAYCLELVTKMKFMSEDRPAEIEEPAEKYTDDRLVLFDTEVFPNLFVISWKYKGSPDKVSLINPTPQQVGELFKLKLVGYNNRRYDNHILYAAYLGYDNHQLFELSKRLIANSPNATFREAYDLSFADLYDILSIKASLKKWQVVLGLRHLESPLPWDEPVPDDRVADVAEYCENDVETLEQTLDHRLQDWVARKILLDLSGLSMNAKTAEHVAKILFGDDRKPQDQFVYTDLSTIFPGYKFELGKSSYKGENPSEGGYVYAEPGMYANVAVLDIDSMHPTSIEQLNLFGPYTKTFSDIKAARVAIKYKDYEKAGEYFGGALKPHLKNKEDADALSFALKIVINTVYGLTSARFANPFKDPRNIDNIVAKRGSLFMIDLRDAVQAKGYTVAHIKTDSIKIPNADEEIIQFVKDFGAKYGYTFQHEDTYEKMCLTNDAVFIAKTIEGKWKAVGAQFQHPVVFKTLFSNEQLTFDDHVETKAVQTAMYLDFDVDKPMYKVGSGELTFVGKHGTFLPVTEGGGALLREKDGKYYFVGGTKDYRWLEAEVVRTSKSPSIIDQRYYDNLVEEAYDAIWRFGDAEAFLD